MLPTLNRLKKDKEFKKVFRFSRPFSSGKIVVRAAKSRIYAASKIGFVISNKIEKRATRRNSLKRQLRAITRKHLSKIVPGFDIVVIVRQNYSFPYSQAEIEKDFLAGLSGAKLLNEKNYR